MRCIVQSLTDEQNGDLFEELRRDNMRIIQHDDDSDDDEVRSLQQMQVEIMKVSIRAHNNVNV